MKFCLLVVYVRRIFSREMRFKSMANVDQRFYAAPAKHCSQNVSGSALIKLRRFVPLGSDSFFNLIIQFIEVLSETFTALPFLNHIGSMQKRANGFLTVFCSCREHTSRLRLAVSPLYPGERVNYVPNFSIFFSSLKYTGAITSELYICQETVKESIINSD